MIDQKLGQKYCAGDEEFYFELLGDFAEDSEKKRKQLLLVAQQENWSEYLTIVHALKGNSMLVGAAEFSELSRIHQAAALEKNYSFIQENYSHYIEELAKLIEEIHSMLS